MSRILSDMENSFKLRLLLVLALPLHTYESTQKLLKSKGELLRGYVLVFLMKYQFSSEKGGIFDQRKQQWEIGGKKVLFIQLFFFKDTKNGHFWGGK